MEQKKTRKIDTSPFLHRYDKFPVELVESCKNYFKAYDTGTEKYKPQKDMAVPYLQLSELLRKYYTKETITIDLPNLKTERDKCYSIRNDLDFSSKMRIFEQFDDIFTQQVSIKTLSGSLFYSWKGSYRMYTPIFDNRTENDRGTPWVFTNISDNASQLGIHIPVQLYEDIICSRGDPKYWYLGLVDGMLDDILLVPSYDNSLLDQPLLYENLIQSEEFWAVDEGGIFLDNILFLRNKINESKDIDNKKKVRLNFPHRADFMDAWYEERELYKDFHTERPYVLLWDFFGCILLRKLAPIRISNNDCNEGKYRLPAQKYIFSSTLREFAQKKKCEINEIISKDSKFYEELISMHNFIYDHRNYS